MLSACSSDPEVRVVTRTEVVEKKVEVRVPLPAELTEPLPYPTPLEEGFTEAEGWELIFTLYDLLDQANEDRASAARLSSE